ncbi:hypothetical protein GCM10027026_31630 [Myroides odoratimimus subsp. xuanwuensis]
MILFDVDSDYQAATTDLVNRLVEIRRQEVQEGLEGDALEAELAEAREESANYLLRLLALQVARRLPSREDLASHGDFMLGVIDEDVVTVHRIEEFLFDHFGRLMMHLEPADELAWVVGKSVPEGSRWDPWDNFQGSKESEGLEYIDDDDLPVVFMIQNTERLLRDLGGGARAAAADWSPAWHRKDDAQSVMSARLIAQAEASFFKLMSMFGFPENEAEFNEGEGDSPRESTPTPTPPPTPTPTSPDQSNLPVG